MQTPTDDRRLLYALGGGAAVVALVGALAFGGVAVALRLTPTSDDRCHDMKGNAVTRDTPSSAQQQPADSPAPPTAGAPTQKKPHGANRLINEKSPYLLQHARNPVDWYPWGEEAFERARREDKPLLLSIGYSTCHWCHVMERESFENEEIAALMNADFVCVKVDREERPDVDAVYMAAVQAMTGRGGWPMTVFVTSEGKPFWGGTYFPPEDRVGMPGFKTVLRGIADAWRSRREDILNSAKRLTAALESRARPPGTVKLDQGTLRKAAAQWRGQYDPVNGGFGSSPKFPRPHELLFLLRYHLRDKNAGALKMVTATLDHIIRGGIHDHLGGGFHRYSTDTRWLVPHFEKMLYDQALLARALLETYQVTGERRYAQAARDAFTYVLRDLADPRGGFHCAEDADAEGVEGKFSVWTTEEIRRALGRDDAAVFSQAYGIREEGNFHDEATGRATGKNIPHLPKPLAEVAADLGTKEAELRARLADMRAKLFEIREQRVRPGLDDKVLADWNSLMIRALAFGGRVLDEPRYTAAASRAATFILDAMMRDGRLMHRYRDGDADIPAFLDDYAFLALGLAELYQATFEPRWLAEAKRLLHDMRRLFEDRENGGFNLGGRDGESLVTTTKESYDGALPSGNSAAALALLLVGRMTGDRGLEDVGQRTLACFSGVLDAIPMGSPFMLMALDFQLGPSREVVLAGDPDNAGLREMVRALAGRYLPNTVVLFHPSGKDGEAIEETAPFLRPNVALNGRATAYVCRNFACRLPVGSAKAMMDQIDEEDDE